MQKRAFKIELAGSKNSLKVKKSDKKSNSAINGETHIPKTLKKIDPQKTKSDKSPKKKNFHVKLLEKEQK